MKQEKYTIILFYKYVAIENPELLRISQRALAEKLNLKGRMIIAHEGINGTFEGTAKQVELYVEKLLKDPRFSDVHIKRSEGTGHAFPKLSIKVRPEIVATHLGEDDVDPTKTTGKYIHAEELHAWIHSGKEFVIVDMRNDYEVQVGKFENSIFPDFNNFRDLKEKISVLDSLKDKTIVTVCTGGVRCEKASGFLVTHGFKDVYQLYGGIVTYMEKYPGEDFEGSLYVFDNRLVMSFNMDDPTRKIIGKCVVCHKPSEHYINCSFNFCHRHFIACEECLHGEETMLCPMGCRDYKKEHPEKFAAI